MILHWFTKSYWDYVLDDSRANSEYGPFNPYPSWRWWRLLEETCSGEYLSNPLAKLGNYIARCYCRAKGHGKVYWMNLGGLEPDMHCRDCGEDLG